MRRRNATTEFLKECMADALLRLLKDKSLDEITISEITDLADVGRVTFYRNFTKKEDLIAFKLKLLADQYFQQMTPQQMGNNHYVIQSIFDFVYSIRDVLTTLYHARLIETSFLPLYEAVKYPSETDRGAELKNSFLLFGMIGIILKWIQDGFKESSQELTEVLEGVLLM
ncbi:MAG: TetR/AcrR family transcriptional regulator [Butyrivibrio sp.]|nr:TetR/AcrR family transcriptional regulator [Muribaculum sp.]MCM1552291.1 TetR/AcrR family transcriptional regulator [Butyrivibrio sp.]